MKLRPGSALFRQALTVPRYGILWFIPVISVLSCYAPRPEIVILRDNPVPCKLVFERSGFVLLDPLRRVEPAEGLARDSRGYIYTGSTSAGQLLIWAPDGRFVQTIGRRGSGPGEFMDGQLQPFIGPGDTLHIRDNSLKWTLYSPGWEFVANRAMGAGTGLKNFTHFLPDGRLLTSFPRPDGKATTTAMILDPEGAIQRRVGSPPVLVPGQRPSGVPSSYLGGGMFWLVGDVDGSGYDLEHWDTAGRMYESLRRVAHWFRPKPKPKRSEPPSPYPRILHIHQDGTGALFVLSAALKEDWTDKVWNLRGEDIFSVVSIRADLIDPDLGMVIASHEFEGIGDMASGFFEGSREGYRYSVPDSTGAGQFEWLTYTPRDGTGNPCRSRVVHQGG